MNYANNPFPRDGNIYLFYYGNENVHLTGGLTSAGYNLPSYTNSELITHPQGKEYIDHNVARTNPGDRYISMFGNNKPIKISSDYRYVNIQYTCTGRSCYNTSYSWRGAYGTSKDCYNNEYANSISLTYNPNNKYTAKASISFDGTSRYYIDLQTHMNGQNWCGYVYKWWLSKS